THAPGARAAGGRRSRDRALLGEARKPHHDRDPPPRDRRDHRLSRFAGPRTRRLSPPVRLPRPTAATDPRARPRRGNHGRIPTMTNLEVLALMHAHDPGRRWNQPTSRDWADVLATIPLFARVSRRRLRGLMRSANLAEFTPGETVVAKGDR